MENPSPHPYTTKNEDSGAERSRINKCEVLSKRRFILDFFSVRSILFLLTHFLQIEISQFLLNITLSTQLSCLCRLNVAPKENKEVNM